MSLTFAEAAEQLRLAIPENFVSPTMHDIAVMLETQHRVLYELRNTYAPIVEMTQAQYDELLGFKHKFGSSHLAIAIHQGSNGTWSFLDELSGRIFGHGIGEATDENIETIMKAWLHPETIKVITDERD